MAYSSATMEGVDEYLAKLHHRYIQQAPRLKRITESILSYQDTWCSSLERLLLETTNEPSEGVINKPNIMNNFGLTLFMLYKSFTYLELIYQIAQCMDTQGFQINTYKEWLVTNDKEYIPLIFIDFSLVAIINAFVIPSSQVNRMKKHVDLKYRTIIFGHYWYCNSNESRLCQGYLMFYSR